MINRKNIYLIALVIMVFGMLLASCDNGPTEVPGTFTITGIPQEYNGKYASLVFIGGESNVVGANWNSTDGFTNVPISGNSVSIPLWVVGRRYNGNEIRNLTVLIQASSSSASETLAIRRFNSITFKNGGATMNWSDGSAL